MSSEAVQATRRESARYRPWPLPAARLCGPGGKHNPDRAGYRHGTEAGSVTPGRRRIPVTRPRGRAAAGSRELHLPSYDLYSSAEILGQLALEKGQNLHWNRNVR